MKPGDPEHASLLAKVREQYGDGIAPDPRLSARGEAAAPPSSAKKPGRSAEQNAAAAQRRVNVGARFQDELDDTHAGLERDRLAHILPHYPPTVFRKSPTGGRSELHYKAGGAPCDYSGHVNLWRQEGAGPKLRAALGDGSIDRFTAQVPVVFDAKVLGAGHASYRHTEEHRSQLEYLAAADACGAIAFLLVRADEIGEAFLVGWRQHGADLFRGRAVKLFEKRRAGSEVETRLGRSVARPVFEVVSLLPSVPYMPGRGWCWPMALPALRP